MLRDKLCLLLGIAAISVISSPSAAHAQSIQELCPSDYQQFSTNYSQLLTYANSQGFYSARTSTRFDTSDARLVGADRETLVALKEGLNGLFDDLQEIQFCLSGEHRIYGTNPLVTPIHNTREALGAVYRTYDRATPPPDFWGSLRPDRYFGNRSWW